MACSTKRLEKKPVLSDGVGTITKLASLLAMASLASMVADRRARLAAISSLSCGSTIGILPAFSASTRVLLTSRPMTVKPRLASTAASGAPSLPRPTTETRGRVPEVISIPVLRAGTDTVGRGGRQLATCAVRRRGEKSSGKARESNESGIFGLSEGLLGQCGGLRRRRQAAPGHRSDDRHGLGRRVDARAGRRPLHRRQEPDADGSRPVWRHRPFDAARRRQGARTRCPRGGRAGRRDRRRGQRRGPQGRDRGRRRREGQPADARRDRRPHRARRAAAQLPLRQVQDQGQARAEALARADHRRAGRSRRGAQGLCPARAHHRRGVLHPRPGERAGQRALSGRVRPPRPRTHQARRQGRDPGRGRDEEARHERAAGRRPGQRARIAAPGHALDERAEVARSRSR